MSKKQISTLDPEVKEEYFQKGWNDPDNLKYLDAGEKYDKHFKHSCVEQLAFYIDYCKRYNWDEKIIALLESLPSDELELDYFLHHNESHLTFVYIVSNNIGKDIKKQELEIHNQRVEIERQKILHTIKNNTEYNKNLFEILNDFGMDFNNQYLCALDMRYRKDNGQFDTYPEAYKYAVEHCTIKGKPIKKWHHLEKAYSNAKDRGYLEDICPRIEKDLNK